MSDRFWLFSYGTLRLSDVQRAVFGRELPCVEDCLPGFRIERLRIVNPDVIALSGSDNHPILRRASPDQAVEGVALAVGADDLEKADRYEAADSRWMSSCAAGAVGGGLCWRP
jgi:Gamma-glutamyl cyclotransferase, AIG2-like